MLSPSVQSLPGSFEAPSSSVVTQPFEVFSTMLGCAVMLIPHVVWVCWRTVPGMLVE
jgi:hypothetical protein